MSQENDKLLRLPDGRLLGYAEYGQPDGLPLLAIHGTPGSRLMLRPADDIARAKNIRLIAPDRPGYGRSTPCPDYRLDQWVDDMEGLLEALSIDRFMLFGISGGGPFATALASLMPHRVEAMALVGPVGIFDQEVRKTWSWSHALFFKWLPNRPLLMKLALPPVRLLVFYAPDLMLKIFTARLDASDRSILSDPRHKEQLLVAFREGFHFGIQGVFDDLRLFANPWRLPFDKALMPVTIWQGLADRMVPIKAVSSLANSLAQAKVVELEGEGHFWIFEHFDEVVERLVEVVKTSNT